MSRLELDGEKYLAEVASDRSWIESNLTEILRRGFHKNIILRWGEDLEYLIQNNALDMRVDHICTYMRNAVKNNPRTEWSLNYITDICPRKWKQASLSRSESEAFCDFIGTTETVPNGSDGKKHDMILRAAEMARQNRGYIELVERTMANLDTLRKKLKTDTAFVPAIDANEFSEFATRWESANAHLAEILDERNQVIPSQFPLYMYCFATSAENFTFDMFVRFVKKWSELSSKQAAKLMSGKVKKIHHLYDPTTEYEATEAGFSGRKCPYCGSYRTERRYHEEKDSFDLFCYAKHQNREWPQWSDWKPKPLAVRLPNIEE